MDRIARDRAAKRFKDHRATVVLENEEFLVFDWRNKNGSGDYAVRYIVDCRKGDLIIKGDLGDCIAGWYNEVTPDDMAHYVDDVNYFIGKFQCSSDRYVYRMEDVKSDLDSLREEYLQGHEVSGFIVEEIEEDFDEMWRLCGEMAFGENVPYPDAFVSIVEKYADPWWESEFADIGRRISERVYLWAVGYQMALKQIRETGKRGAEWADQSVLASGAWHG